MYTAPTQKALRMIRARISTAAIVDSLAQHVLSHRICNCIRLHQTAYMFAPCNHILTPHSLSTRLCLGRIIKESPKSRTPGLAPSNYSIHPSPMAIQQVTYFLKLTLRDTALFNEVQYWTRQPIATFLFHHLSSDHDTVGFSPLSPTEAFFVS
ncbi:Uncharacterized protein HZ326_12021 [Fusarium oxysporum f. sp. albedinis]|nr:Uncharacterized protein HZ326_12021 [Fusarium oxysporum f. sp. albedinis]